jgi:hypothetical protein
MKDIENLEAVREYKKKQMQKRLNAYENMSEHQFEIIINKIKKELKNRYSDKIHLIESDHLKKLF